MSSRWLSNRLLGSQTRNDVSKSGKWLPLHSDVDEEMRGQERSPLTCAGQASSDCVTHLPLWDFALAVPSDERACSFLPGFYTSSVSVKPHVPKRSFCRIFHTFVWCLFFPVSLSCGIRTVLFRHTTLTVEPQQLYFIQLLNLFYFFSFWERCLLVG